eukprot:scaffold66234_cov35-Tisochrysis_lutea.AAC.1
MWECGMSNSSDDRSCEECRLAAALIRIIAIQVHSYGIPMCKRGGTTCCDVASKIRLERAAPLRGESAINPHRLVAQSDIAHSWFEQPAAAGQLDCAAGREGGTSLELRTKRRLVQAGMKRAGTEHAP